MLDIFKKYATDAGLELNGVEHELDSEGKAKIVVARMGNAKFQKAYQAALERHQKELDSKDDEVKEAAQKRCMVESMARSILVGFSGLGYNGEPMEYSVENAERLLALDDFRTLVFELSRDVDHYRVEKESAVAKN